MITLLQHTHPALPHYTTEKWSWLRGALATCDRSFGFLDTFHHHIADTHVLHHLFSTIPHYHAQVLPACQGACWSDICTAALWATSSQLSSA